MIYYLTSFDLKTQFMEQRIKRIVMYLKALYVFCWAVPLLVGIASEMDTPWLGILAGDVRATYGVETLVILLTVVCVPLSLKLFAWVLARRIDAVGIYLLLSNKCLLCGLIALVAMLFCVPGRKRLCNELHIGQGEEG